MVCAGRHAWRYQQRHRHPCRHGQGNDPGADCRGGKARPRLRAEELADQVVIPLTVREILDEGLRGSWGNNTEPGWICCYWPRELNKTEKNKAGGERGIRTLDTLLEYARFPGVCLQPLGHLSTENGTLAVSAV